MGIVILIVVIVVTFYLGRYAILEGLKIENNNQIMENIRKMEQRDIMDKRKEIIYERNPDTDTIRSRNIGDYKNTVINSGREWDHMDDGVCEGEYVHPKDVQDFLERADSPSSKLPWSEEEAKEIQKLYLVAGMTNDRERDFIKFQKKQSKHLKTIKEN